MTRHAIVVGASVAGLLAARTLADHVDRVTLLERDAFPPLGDGRRGVPQGGHVHALMARGREIMEDLFPGLTSDLLALGAPLADPRVRGRWFLNGGYYDRRQVGGGQHTVLVRRPVLEGMVRARVLGLPNVCAVQCCDALGFVADDDRRRVVGVHVLHQDAGSAEEVLRGDVVVDASGRGSRTPAWLERLGYPRPAEEQVRVGLTYTSRLYRRRPDDLGGDDFAIVFPHQATRRAGLAAAQEGERWLVTLAGYLGEHAPTDDAGFREYARSLLAPDVHDLIGRAEPLTDAVSMRFPASRRRRYERLARFPQGLVVTGDALCSFNPVYAQGMTVAALEALALGRSIASGVDGIGGRFFRQAGKVVDAAWDLAASGDLRFPDIDGDRTARVRFVNWYLDRLHVAAHHDAVVAAAFQRVVNMLAPPPSVLHPRIAVRVAWGNRPSARSGQRRAPVSDGRALPNPPTHVHVPTAGSE